MTRAGRAAQGRRGVQHAAVPAVGRRTRSEIVAFMTTHRREVRGLEGARHRGQRRPGVRASTTRRADGDYAGWAVVVMETSDGRVSGLHHFIYPELFAEFGLPRAPRRASTSASPTSSSSPRSSSDTLRSRTRSPRRRARSCTRASDSTSARSGAARVDVAEHLVGVGVHDQHGVSVHLTAKTTCARGNPHFDGGRVDPADAIRGSHHN